MKWLRSSEEKRAVRISVDSDGVFVLDRTDHASQGKQIHWKDVSVVIAYKKDCFAFDQVRVELLGGTENMLLTEQDDGFADFITALPQHLQSIDAKWYLELLTTPAFDQIVRTIYTRN